MNAINSCFETLAVLTLLGVCLLFWLHVPLLHGNLGNGTENHLADCSHKFSVLSIYIQFHFIFCSQSKCLYLNLFLVLQIYFCSFSQLAVFRSMLFTSAEEQVQRSMVNNFRVQQAVKGRTVRSSFTPFIQDTPSMK